MVRQTRGYGIVEGETDGGGTCEGRLERRMGRGREALGERRVRRGGSKGLVVNWAR